MRCFALVAIAIFVSAWNLADTGVVHAQSLRRLETTEIRIAPDLTVTKTIHQETTPLVESAVRAVAQSQWAVQGTRPWRWSRPLRARRTAA